MTEAGQELGQASESELRQFSVPSLDTFWQLPPSQRFDFLEYPGISWPQLVINWSATLKGEKTLAAFVGEIPTAEPGTRSFLQQFIHRVLNHGAIEELLKVRVAFLCHSTTVVS